jgi:hypothetical protein
MFIFKIERQCLLILSDVALLIVDFAIQNKNGQKYSQIFTRAERFDDFSEHFFLYKRKKTRAEVGNIIEINFY